MKQTLARLAAAAGLHLPRSTGASTTCSEANRDTRVDLPRLPPGERRQSDRCVVHRPLVLIPVLPNGGPDWKHRVEGATLDVSPNGIGMLLDDIDELPTTSAVLVAPHADGTTHCAGLEIKHSRRKDDSGRLWVGASAGGFAAELLRPANLAPRFCPQNLQFVWHIAEDILRSWADVGVLKPLVLDRVLLCPKCRRLPTFRHGCRHCGSIRVVTDQLVHHFACAHVGLLEDFAAQGELRCPKCHTRKLVIGSDYEHQTGPFRCHDCRWTDAELQSVGQCLACHFRFPGEQAVEVELGGFHVERLDLLALVPASGASVGPAVGVVAD